MHSLFIENVQACLGSAFNVDWNGKHVRIQTPLQYPDGDLIDVFIDENYIMTTLTDFGETIRWLLNTEKFKDELSKDLLGTRAAIQDIMKIDFEKQPDSRVNQISKCIKGLEDLKDGVIRVALACSAIASLY